MKFRKKVIGDRIVYANWFLRQLDALWDFIYFHVLPVRTWYRLVNCKDRVVYAFERAFTGFDRRISWGYESSIHFYKRLLGDLYKYSQAFPGNLEDIAPEEWESMVVDKWLPKFKDKEAFDRASLFCGDDDGLTDDERSEFSDDCFNAWKAYIKRVLHYFEEADADTCSQKNELEGQFKWSMGQRKVTEINGELFYMYESTAGKEKSEQDLINDRIFKRDREIEKYRLENLKLGMQEVAKNILRFCD